MEKGYRQRRSKGQVRELKGDSDKKGIFVFLDFAFGANISQSKKPLQELNGSLVSKCQ